MENRDRLLEVARQLFASRGYDAVGIQEIVDTAGVTKPTLYHYFQNKRGLLDAVLEHDFAGLIESVRAAAFYQGDLPFNIERLIRACFDYAVHNPQFYRMQLGLYFAPPESESNQAVQDFNLQVHELVAELFANASADHGNMRGRQRAYAASLLGMIHTYIGLYLNGYTVLDEALVYQTARQFMHGIYS
jgi:AcrR family transcriptional regulator